MKPLAAIITIGCRLNHADSGLMHARLSASGMEVAEYEKLSGPPALVVVNSCAVTANAAATTRSAVRRVRREYPGCGIILTGCGAAAIAAELKDCGVRVVTDKRLVAADELPEGADREEDGFPVFREGGCGDAHFRSRAFIKVQEGCGNFCAYCIVPFTRGRERSRDWDETLEDCRRAAAAGFPEIVLTGVNICAYRCGGRGLAELLEAIGKLPGEFRIRLSSTEPHPGDGKFLRVFCEMAASGRVCRFLHLPLQSGCDSVLERMGRRYRTAEYAGFVDRIRERVPGVHIGTDLITGFPGESDGEFAAGAEFVRRMAFSNAHVFTYSPRAGTRAAAMRDQVPPRIAAERSRIISEITGASASRFVDSQRGLELPVIFERTDAAGTAVGWSDNYISVSASGVPTGRIVRIKFR